MKILLSWLKEFIDCPHSAEEIAATLTRAGLEVDAITHLGNSFTNVVAAKIVHLTPHPNAARLQIATVDDGHQRLQIVCGASNCQRGMIVACARIGATVLDEQQQQRSIKIETRRQVASQGMLCPPFALGIPGDNDKILQLPSTLPLGTDLRSYLADVCIELSITPNLGHCLSVRGIARELAAQWELPLRTIAQRRQDDGSAAQRLLAVEIADPACKRYCARIIRGLRVADSPEWLRRRLQQCGLPSINNIVDATNYAMLALGQPLHAFDRAKIVGNTIRIATSPAATTLTTRQQREISIPTATLTVSDLQGPLAIAGVIGGQRAAVGADARDIVLEAAHFSEQAIRTTCKQIGYTSEAAYRFARGIDPLQLIPALDFAADLICALAGGEIAAGIVTAATTPQRARYIVCSPQRCNQLLGSKLTSEQITAFLQRSGCTVVAAENGQLQVAIPSHRNDLVEAIDLVAEIARRCDWQQLPETASHVSISQLPEPPLARFADKVRSSLVHLGLQECISCPLISTENPLAGRLQVLHSRSAEYSTLRSSLLPGLLQIVKFNQDRQNHDLPLFTIGRTYFPHRQGVEERLQAAIVLSGNQLPFHWQHKAVSCDFFDLTGKLEMLSELLALPPLQLTTSHLPTLHPQQQAQIYCAGRPIGSCGALHPQLAQQMEIAGALFFAQLELQEMLSQSQWEHCSLQPLPLYPGSSRDWTVRIAKSLSLQQLRAAIADQRSPFLTQIVLLDLYQQQQTESHHNVTLRFYYRDSQRTLEAETVEREHQRLLQSVHAALSAFILPLP